MLITERLQNRLKKKNFFFACGTLIPQPGIDSAPLALEGALLTTGPPGKPQTDLDGQADEEGCWNVSGTPLPLNVYSRSFTQIFYLSSNSCRVCQIQNMALNLWDILSPV